MESIYNKSFDELLDEAKIESNEWIKLVCERYEGNSVNLEEFTKSFIYDGYKVGSKMKVFDSVYKKEEKKKWLLVRLVKDILMDTKN